MNTLIVFPCRIRGSKSSKNGGFDRSEISEKFVLNNTKPCLLIIYFVVVFNFIQYNFLRYSMFNSESEIPFNFNKLIKINITPR